MLLAEGSVVASYYKTYDIRELQDVQMFRLKKKIIPL